MEYSTAEYYSTTEIEQALTFFDHMPQGIWWKDKEHKYRLMNHATSKMLGYDSSRISFECVTDFDLPCKAIELADDFIAQDNLVMRSKKQLSGICFCGYSNGDWKVLMGHRFPRYDHRNNVIGTSGTSIDITNCAVMRSALLLLSDDDKLIGRKINQLQQFTYMLKTTYDDFGLTQRQSEILFLLIRGKTAKEIASKLELSFRTVQNTIEVIKEKMNCFSRSELIEKAIESGAGSVIPKSIIGPRAQNFIEYDKFQLVIDEVESEDNMLKLIPKDSANAFHMFYVQSKGWYFHGKIDDGVLYSDYLSKISDLLELYDLIHRKTRSEISDLSRQQLLYIIVSNLIC